MINDRVINELAQPLISQLISVEADLLKWIASNFDLYDSIGGSLEWKLKQLSRIGLLDNKALKIIAEGSQLSYIQIRRVIEEAGIKSVDRSTLRKAYEKGLVSKSIDNVVFNEVLSSVVQLSNNEMSLVFQEISRNVSLEYRKILDVVNLEVTQGISTYDEALKKSLNQLAQKGITSMTYQRTIKDANGNEIKVPVNYSIEGVARRTIVSAITRTANAYNEHIADELGVDYYVTSQHLGARNKGVGHVNHESWQGRVFQISTGEFERETGEGLVDGLGGVNCRHIKFAYIPDVSVIPPKKIDKDENDKLFELEQKQRGLERKVREAKKQLAMAEQLGDEEYINQSKANLRDKQKNINKFVKENGLRRDYAREQIQQDVQVQPKIETSQLNDIVPPRTVENPIITRENAIKQFKDSGFKNIDLKGLEDKPVIEMAKGSRKFDEEFPQLKGYVENLKTVNANDYDGAYRPAFNDILISNNETYDKVLIRWENERIIGVSIRGGFGYEHLMVHERTHSIEMFLNKMRHPNDWRMRFDSMRKGKISKEIIKKAYKGLGIHPTDKSLEWMRFDAISDLGSYAMSMPQEMLAQAITDAISNPNPLPFSLEVLKEVKRRLSE